MILNVLKSVRDYPVPRTVKQVARFVGMTNYFSKFIPNYSREVAKLNILRKKGVKFKWSAEQQEAFQNLKTALVSPPVLAVPDFSKQFILQSDACGSAVSAILLQQYPEGRRVVSYASRMLTEQEKKFSIYELEALAVLYGLERFRFYLEHTEFLLETDNQALSWVLARPRKSGRLVRWALRISAFKFKVQHIRGVVNCVADALSRMYGEKTPAQACPPPPLV